MKKVLRFVIIMVDILVAPIIVLLAIVLSWGIIVGGAHLIHLGGEGSNRVSTHAFGFAFAFGWFFFIILVGCIGGLLAKIYSVVWKALRIDKITKTGIDKTP